MSTPTQHMLLLRINGRASLSPADYQFHVHGKGCTPAADLRIGDQVHDPFGQDAAIDAITDLGEQSIVCYMDMDSPPYRQAGLLLSGTIIATEDGYKRVEDLRPGDRILSGAPEEPVWNCSCERQAFSNLPCSEDEQMTSEQTAPCPEQHHTARELRVLAGKYLRKVVAGQSNREPLPSPANAPLGRVTMMIYDTHNRLIDQVDSIQDETSS